MTAVVALTALLAAVLTLFSGFGLGSLLLPAFAVFLPLEIAVAATAVVHLANNLFKAAMLARFADRRVVLVFGVPGALAALGGALVLEILARGAPLLRWPLGGRDCEVTPASLAIGGLILAFALFELHPRGRRVAFARRWLPLGGALSGFLGGLSGHQGALRSAFLLRLGMPKETYVGTGVLCAIVMDLARLSVYGATEWRDQFAQLGDVAQPVLAGTGAAFVGSWVGRRLMGKVTMESIHVLVGVLLVLLGAAIAAGVV